MPHPKYSKTAFERDLADKVVSFDEQARDEIAAAPIPQTKLGRPVVMSVQRIRQHHREIFNAAYDRHCRTNGIIN